jgi:two-component system NarL family response regulator
MIERRPDMTVVGEAATGREAVAAYRAARPDVVLMDLRMPDMTGVEAIGAIRGEFPGARIIVLTTYDGDEDIYRGLQAGARAYLLKDAPRDDLLDAIRAVHAGQSRIPPAVAARLAERVLAGPELTARELEVLRGIVAGRSNKEIGAALGISEGTVKAHVNSILGKLGVADRTQAVTTALQRGIVHLD